MDIYKELSRFEDWDYAEILKISASDILQCSWKKLYNVLEKFYNEKEITLEVFKSSIDIALLVKQWAYISAQKTNDSYFYFGTKTFDMNDFKIMIPLSLPNRC